MENGYKGLTAYKEAMSLAATVYEVTKRMPREELYGLVSQLRRAAVSVPSNIAEGYGKSSTGEYLSALGHARGSLFEIETQVEIARSAGIIEPAD